LLAFSVAPRFSSQESQGTGRRRSRVLHWRLHEQDL